MLLIKHTFLSCMCPVLYASKSAILVGQQISRGFRPRMRLPPFCRNSGSGLTSYDGQLGVDRDLALTVLGDALVDVLVPGGPERLDPEDGPRTLVKLDGLQGRTATQK